MANEPKRREDRLLSWVVSLRVSYGVHTDDEVSVLKFEQMRWGNAGLRQAETAKLSGYRSQDRPSVAPHLFGRKNVRNTIYSVEKMCYGFGRVDRISECRNLLIADLIS